MEYTKTYVPTGENRGVAAVSTNTYGDSIEFLQMLRDELCRECFGQLESKPRAVLYADRHNKRMFGVEVQISGDPPEGYMRLERGYPRYN